MYTPLAEFDISLLNSTEVYIHHATQFLAMTGKNYLQDEADDSNANVRFDGISSRIVGRVLGESLFSVTLNVPDWQQETIKGDAVNDVFPLAGKLKDEIFDWLKNQLSQNGFDQNRLRFIDHYEIPDHEVDLGQPFQELRLDQVNTWLTMRSNANLILEELNAIVGIDSEVRIWPHHFDTGTYYELGDKLAIGAGWAIADTLCDNPYLYIYGWNGNAEVDYSSVPPLSIGKWIVTDGWQGAAVESAELSVSDNQYERLLSFMNEATSFLKSQLK